MPVLLIRHAHAGSRQDWTGDDASRPLSPQGRRQSRALVEILRPWTPRRVVSSPYQRCVETVAPLARALGLEVEVDGALAEGRAADALALTRRLADAHVALCTHGDVVPEVLAALADRDGLDIGRPPPRAKGSTWVLSASCGRFVTAAYLPPPD